MNLRDDLQLENAKAKLRLLEQSYEEARTDSEEDEHTREVTLESLQRLINQFRAEIAQYEAHQLTSR